MKTENVKILLERYPGLLGGGDPRQPFRMFGFECGDGWFDIIDRLCADLTRMVKEDLEGRFDLYRVCQIKEKFGTLRFYLDYTTSELEARICRAEEETAVTCENCGAPGKPNEEGWITVLCDNCRAGRGYGF